MIKIITNKTKSWGEKKKEVSFGIKDSPLKQSAPLWSQQLNPWHYRMAERDASWEGSAQSVVEVGNRDPAERDADLALFSLCFFLAAFMVVNTLLL